jgi:hypothetical protein
LRLKLRLRDQIGNRVCRDRLGRIEIPAVAEFKQAARRIEDFAAMAAAHQPATQRKLCRL